MEREGIFWAGEELAVIGAGPCCWGWSIHLDHKEPCMPRQSVFLYSSQDPPWEEDMAVRGAV